MIYQDDSDSITLAQTPAAANLLLCLCFLARQGIFDSSGWKSFRVVGENYRDVATNHIRKRAAGKEKIRFTSLGAAPESKMSRDLQ